MRRDELKQQFEQLCAEGKIDEAVALLKREDSYGFYLSDVLAYAAQKGHFEAAKSVFRSWNEEVKSVDLNKFLNEMISNTSPEGVRLALELGADVNKVYLSESPLMHVCQYSLDRKKQVEMARLLIEAGADINAQDNYDQNTALIEAVSSPYPNKELIKFLLDNGADVSLTNKEGLTALDILNKDQFGRNQDIIELIMRSQEGTGALDTAYQTSSLVSAISSKNMDLARQMIERGDDVNRPDAQGKTPLMAAAEARDARMVSLLLENGADINARDNQGNPALLYAFSRLQNSQVIEAFLNHPNCEINFNDPILPTLIKNTNASDYKPYIHHLVQMASEQNDNPNWMFVKNSEGLNALTAALEQKDYRLVRQILRSCPSAWKENKDEVVKLLQAAANTPEGLDVVLGAGVDINTTDSNGDTALILAAKSNSHDAVSNLMRYGADASISNNQRQTIETVVSSSDHGSARNAYEGFSSSGYDYQAYQANPEAINQKDQHGHTPLMRAVMQNRIDIVQELLKYNPDLTLTDNRGQTVLEYCAARSNPVMMRTLLAYAHQHKPVEGTQGVVGEEAQNLNALLESIKTLNKQAFDEAIRKLPRLDVQNEQGENPLQAACRVLQALATNQTQDFSQEEKETVFQMVKDLASRSSAPLMSDGDKSPLIILAKTLRYAQSPEDKKYIESVMCHLVDKSSGNTKDGHGVSLLEYALQENAQDLVKKIVLERNVNLDEKTPNGETLRQLLEEKGEPYRSWAQQQQFGTGYNPHATLRTVHNKPYEATIEMAVGMGNSDMIASMINEGVYPTSNMIWDINNMDELYQKGCADAWSLATTERWRIRDTIQANQGNTALHYLVKDGYYQETAKLLRHIGNENAKAFLNTPNEQGVTPLMVAMQTGDQRMVDLLLYHGADPMACDKDGKDAFSYASNSALATHLVEQTERPQTGSAIGQDASTPEQRIGTTDTDKFLEYLHQASICASDENWREYDAKIGEALALYENESNININAVHPQTSKTALMMAVEMGDVGLVSKLLEDPRMTSESLTFKHNGKTALDMAVANGEGEMIRSLTRVYQERDCNIGDPTAPGKALLLAKEGKIEALLELAEKHRLDIKNTRDADGRSVLHHLASRSDFKTINELLQDSKQDITTQEFVVPDNNGNSALDILASNGQKERVSNFAKVRFYEELQKGAQANVDVVRELLEHGGQDILNQRDEYGQTPLTYAIKSGNAQLVNLLLSQAKECLITLENGEQVSPEQLARNMLAQAQQSGDEQAKQNAQNVLNCILNSNQNGQGALATLNENSEQRITTVQGADGVAVSHQSPRERGS